MIVNFLTLTIEMRLLRNSQRPCIFRFKRVYAVSVGIYQRYNYSLLMERINRIEGTTAGSNRHYMRYVLSPIKWT